MKVGFLITARLKSQRLPKKLCLELEGENYLTWMIRRLKLTNVLHEIVVCTSTNPQDDELEAIASKEGVKCFRGSEEDVILRLYEAAVYYNLDYVVNMTADAPLLPFDLIPDLIKSYQETDADLVKCHHLPVGLYLSGLKPAAMKKLLDLKASERTEYWLYFFLKTDMFKVHELKTPMSLNACMFRLALDYPEDHEVFKKIFSAFGKNTYALSSQEIVDWMCKHPEVIAMNESCGKKGQERTDNDPHSKLLLKSGKVIL